MGFVWLTDVDSLAPDQHDMNRSYMVIWLIH